MNAVNYWLYIGKYSETLQLELLQTHQIGAMLQLADMVRQPGIETLYLAVEDGEPLDKRLVRQGVQFVLSQKGEGKKVLVACGAGMSRSAAFVLACLKEAENVPLLEGLKWLKQQHPPTMIHKALWDSLTELYGEEVSFRRALAVMNKN